MKLRLLIAFLVLSITAYAQPCITNSNSLLFNGTTSEAACTTENNMVITDSITIEAWINASAWAATSAQGTILCKHSWSQTEQGYVLRAGGTGTLSFNFAGIDTNGNVTSWRETVSNGSMTLNTWYHVAGTYDGNVTRIYINGALVGSNTYPGTMVASTAYPVKIGALSDPTIGQGRFWNGKLDEIRVWHRVLSQTELTANKSKHLDPATAVGLVGYWRFNEGTGTMSTDLSTSGNDVTLSNAAWSNLVPFNETPAVPVIQQSGVQLYTSITGMTYQWSLAGNPVTGATFQSFSPAQPGLYTLTITNGNGCSSTSAAFNFTGTAINDIEVQNSIVYPNPSSGVIYIKDRSINSFDALEVYDISGKLLQSEKLSADKTAIQLSHKTKGVYFIKLLNADQQVTQKLILF